MKKAFITLVFLLLGSTFLVANQRYQSNVLGQNLGPVERSDGYTLLVDKGVRTLFFDGIPQKTITEETKDSLIEETTKDLLTGSLVRYTKKDGQLITSQDGELITSYTAYPDGKIQSERTIYHEELVSFTRYYYGLNGQLSSTICKKGDNFIYNNYSTLSSQKVLLTATNQTFSRIDVVGNTLATSRYTGEEKTGGIEVSEENDGGYTLLNSVTGETEVYDSLGLLREKTSETERLRVTITYVYDEQGVLKKKEETTQEKSASSPYQLCVFLYNEGILVREEQYRGNELQMIVTFSDSGQVKQLFEHEALYCTMYYDTTGKKLLAIDYPHKEGSL